MNLNIGIIYSGSGSKLLCYTNEGVFLEDSFFSIKEKFSETIWFTNLKEEMLLDSGLNKSDLTNFKTTSYFGESIASFMSFYGFKITKENIVFVLKKYYDIVNVLVLNVLLQNEKSDHLSKLLFLKSHKAKKRLQLLKKTSFFHEFISLVSLSNPKSMKVGEKSYVDFFGVNKKINIMPNSYYKIPSTIDNRTLNTWLKVYSLHPANTVIEASKPFEIEIKTLNKDVLTSIEPLEVFNSKEYKIVNLEKNMHSTEDTKKILRMKFELFRIKITGLDEDKKKSVLSAMMRNDFIVSKKVLLELINMKIFKIKIIDGLILNDDLLKELKEVAIVESKLNEIFDQVDRGEVSELFNRLNIMKSELPPSKIVTTELLNKTISSELALNKYQLVIYLDNYLQTILLNDNFLLNELIKSELLLSNLKILEGLILQGIEVIRLNEKSITIAIGYEEKESTRNFLEINNLVYSSKLF